ncbi:MAG: hypothetical protein ACXWBM_11710 [Chthoniobacterales bacterium]
MKLLLTGACGFVGSSLARAILAHRSGLEIFGVDNFIRPGSETNREELRRLGVVRSLEAEGIQTGDELRIGGVALELDPAE